MIFFLSELKLHSAVGEEWFFFRAKFGFLQKGAKTTVAQCRKELLVCGASQLFSLPAFLLPRKSAHKTFLICSVPVREIEKEREKNPDILARNARRKEICRNSYFLPFALYPPLCIILFFFLNYLPKAKLFPVEQ